MEDSWIAVLLTSIEYVANDLRKKHKQFMMSVVTVFLTVSLITFLDMMTKLSPILTLQQAVSSTGDYDVMLTGDLSSVKTVQGNTNWYTDELEFFNAPY